MLEMNPPSTKFCFDLFPSEGNVEGKRCNVGVTHSTLKQSIAPSRLSLLPDCHSKRLKVKADYLFSYRWVVLRKGYKNRITKKADSSESAFSI